MSLQEVVHKCRHSWVLPVLVVFFTQVVDGVAIAFLLPLLPRILREYYCYVSTLDNMTSSTQNTNFSSTNVFYNGSRPLGDVTENGSRPVGDVTETVNATICDDVTISFRVGLVTGIGPAAEVLMNPMITFLISAWGDNTIFSIGAAFQIIGISYMSFVAQEWGLFLGRIFLSLGSSMSIIAGYTLLVSAIEDDSLRVRALSFAYSGLTVGYLIGYSFGGFLYELFGGHIMFSFILVPSIIDVLLRLLIPRTSNSSTEITTWKNVIKLLTDPYLILTSFLIFVSFGVPLLILATLPNYLVNRTSQWQISILYFIATAIETCVQFIASIFVQTHGGRVGVISLSFTCQTIGVICVIFDWNVWVYLVPIALIRVGEGLLGGMVTSLLAYISDVRLLKPYNAVYAVYCATMCAAMAVSPICAGYLVPHIGFHALCLSTAGITFLALLLSLTLINVPAKQETLEEDSELITR